LEAKIFDLSKAILQRRRQTAFDLLYQLRVHREEPIAVLGTLSNAFADLYRGKVASASGMPADALARAFKSYKNKEWKLKNAVRDSARISVDALRNCLEILAETDTTLKLRSGDEWVLLEQTVARLTEAL
jgi:DNA polymerase-3 subunit delta